MEFSNCSGPEIVLTRKLYLAEMFLMENASKIVSIRNDGEAKTSFAVIESVLYPGGGGQPCDRGTIQIGDTSCEIISVKNEDNIHWHSISSPEFPLTVNAECRLVVDAQLRRYHSRLHSAGHLIDAAFIKLGLSRLLLPSKGYHFPAGPNVEYVVRSDEFQVTATLLAELNQAMMVVMEENSPIVIHSNVSRSHAIHRYHVQEELLPIEFDNFRLVGVGGLISVNDDEQISISICPCGGTHVSCSGEVGRVEISKIKQNNEKIKGSDKRVKILKVNYNIAL